jgi:hypothetical protein
MLNAVFVFISDVCSASFQDNTESGRAPLHFERPMQTVPDGVRAGVQAVGKGVRQTILCRPFRTMSENVLDL